MLDQILENIRKTKKNIKLIGKKPDAYKSINSSSVIIIIKK
jgi:hypothetical protein